MGNAATPSVQRIRCKSNPRSLLLRFEPCETELDSGQFSNWPVGGRNGVRACTCLGPKYISLEDGQMREKLLFPFGTPPQKGADKELSANIEMETFRHVPKSYWSTARRKTMQTT